MFWKRKSVSGSSPQQAAEFDAAREATRRAAFLNNAGKISNDQEHLANLRTLFDVCRAEVLRSGALIGKSASEIDTELEAICDQDVDQLKNASDEEFVAFSVESGHIVKKFLSDRGIA